MRQRVRWLQGLLQQLGLQQIWVLPFDDPSGQFTPLYQDLVKGYVEVLKAASAHLTVSSPTAVAPRPGHLSLAGRT